MPETASGIRDSRTTLFAYHGLSLQMPRSWNPVKLDGNWSQGQALFADLDRPRLGLRWRATSRRRFDPAAWASKAMCDEVGTAAAERARPVELDDQDLISPMLSLDHEPPGRDVFLTYSRRSRRVIELIYHSHRRDRVLADTILPTLSDTGADEPTRWSVFDLACTSPAGFRLISQRLNAGDLSLTFALKRQRATVRQIALASMALARQPLDRWLNDQIHMEEKHYRPVGNLQEIEFPPGRIASLMRKSVRRRRYVWNRSLAPELFTFVFQDEQRDRIVIAQGSDQAALAALAASVGR